MRQVLNFVHPNCSIEKAGLIVHGGAKKKSQFGHLMSTAQTFSQVHSILITSNSPCSVRPLLLKLWRQTQKRRVLVLDLCSCFHMNRGVAERRKGRVSWKYLTHLRMLSFGRAARKLLTPSSPSWLLDKLGAKQTWANVLLYFLFIIIIY